MKTLALDFETRGLNPKELPIDEWILGYSLSNGTVTKAYKWGQESKHNLFTLVEECRLVCYNASFELTVLKHLGYDLDKVNYIDAALMLYALNPNADEIKGSRHSLAAWASRYGLEKTDSGVSKKTDWSNAVWDEQMSAYCANDALITYKLFDIAKDLLTNDKPALDFVIKVSNPFCRSIAEMSAVGVRFDKPKLEAFIDEQKILANDYLVQLRQAVGCKVPGTKKTYAKPQDTDKMLFVEEINVPDNRKTAQPGTRRTNFVYRVLEDFNPSSPGQVIWVVENVCKVKLSAKTKGGNISVGKAIINKIDHPLARLLRQYKTAQKFIESFGDSLFNKMDAEGRVHPSINQTGTITGRLSMNSPNIQQAPREGAFRECVIPSEGKVLIGCDMGGFQIKILAVLLAQLAGNTGLLDKMNSGTDAHTATAELINATRQVGKTLNFSIAFGAEALLVADLLSISADEAQVYLDNVSEFLGVGELKEFVWAVLKRQKGVMHDTMGRRFFYGSIISSSFKESSRAKRQSFNAIIQGLESSVMQHVTERCRLGFKALGIDAALVVQVHDELVIEVSPVDSAKAADVMSKVFSDKAYLPSLTMFSNLAKIGNTWAETH